MSDPAPDPRAACTACGAPDARDVTLAWVMSFVVWSARRSGTRRLCGRCARRAALGRSFLTGLLGWWGLPGARRAARALRANARAVGALCARGWLSSLAAAASAAAGPVVVLGGLAAALVVLSRPADRQAPGEVPARRVNLRAAALRDEAADHARAGKWDEAGYLLEAALDADPSSIALRRDLAMVRVKTGLYDQAIALLKEAIEAEPEAPALLADLARACFEAQRYGDAERAARDAFALAPDDRDVRALLGIILMASRSPAEALPYLLAVSAVGLPDPHLDAEVGQCLYDLGRIEEAVARLFECAKRLPDEVDVHERYQDALVAFGQLDDARLLYGDRAKRRARDADAQFLLARLYPPGETADDALARALATDPEHGRARTRLAKNLAAQNRGDEAAALLREGLQSKSDNAEATMALAEVLAGLGRHDQADLVLQRWIRHHWYAVPFRTTLIHLRLERGDLAGAKEALAEAMSLEHAVGALRRAELLRAASWVDLWAACENGTGAPDVIDARPLLPPFAGGSAASRPTTTRAAAGPSTAPAMDGRAAAALDHLDLAESLARGAPRFLNRCRFDRAMARLCLGHEAQALATLAAMETGPARPLPDLLARVGLYRGILLARSGRSRSAAAAWRRVIEVNRKTPLSDLSTVLAARHLRGEAPASEVEAALTATAVRNRPILLLALSLYAHSRGDETAARRYAERGLALPRRRLHEIALFRSLRPLS